MASIFSPWSKPPSATASDHYALPESLRDSTPEEGRVAIGSTGDCHGPTAHDALFLVPLLREPLLLLEGDLPRGRRLQWGDFHRGRRLHGGDLPRGRRLHDGDFQQGDRKSVVGG